MASWPKTIYIRGVGIPVGSWEEMDEVIQRYGSDSSIVITAGEGSGETQKPPPKPTGQPGLNHTDRTLLEQFVEGEDRGVPTAQIGSVLGRRGKGVLRALDSWSRRIGLVNEDGASAFEPVKRWDGRGFRLTEVYIRAARSILGAKKTTA